MEEPDHAIVNHLVPPRRKDRKPLRDVQALLKQVIKRQAEEHGQPSDQCSPLPGSLTQSRNRGKGQDEGHRDEQQRFLAGEHRAAPQQAGEALLPDGRNLVLAVIPQQRAGPGRKRVWTKSSGKGMDA